MQRKAFERLRIFVEFNALVNSSRLLSPLIPVLKLQGRTRLTHNQACLPPGPSYRCSQIWIILIWKGHGGSFCHLLLVLRE
jgi:hypothetical protein